PLPGVITDIVDETGQSVGRGKGGILVIKRPWPSMIRTIWGDPERFKKSYYPDDFKGKYYLAGDGASTDEDGYYRIMGRSDNLPKTRSGKIMRRLLRSIAKGEAITQDVSTLENPAILEQLKQTL